MKRNAHPSQGQLVPDPSPARIAAMTAKLRAAHLAKLRAQGAGPLANRHLGFGRVAEVTIRVGEIFPRPRQR